MIIKKLDLYLIKSFLGPFIVTFFVVLFAFVMQHFWLYMDEIIGKGLGAGIIIQYFFLISTTLAPVTLPLGLLLAAIMTFGNLGEHFELVAIKSSGISLFRFLRPLAILAIIISIASFLIQNYLVPVINLKTYSLLYDMRSSKPTLNIKEGVFNRSFEGFSIRVGKKDADGKRISDILIYDHISSRGNRNVVTAERGKMFTSADGRFLVFELENGWRYEESGEGTQRQQTRMNFKSWSKVFDLSKFKFSRTKEELFKGNELMMNVVQLKTMMDSAEIKKQIEFKRSYNELSRQINILDTSKNNNIVSKQAINTHKAVPYKDFLTTFVADTLQRQVIAYADGNLRSSKSALFGAINESVYNIERLTKLEIEYHRKFALSVACILLFIIGAPLGAIIRKGGIGMPVVVGVSFFVVYFVLSSTGEKLAKEGSVPVWFGMWLSTFFITPFAIFLANKARKDSALFNKDSYMKFVKKISKRFHFLHKIKEAILQFKNRIFYKPTSIFIAFAILWWFVGSILYLVFGEETLFRFINEHHNPALDFIAWYGTQLGEGPIMIASYLVVFLWRKEFRNIKFIILATVAMLMPALLINLLKQIADAPRPLYVFEGQKWLHYLPYYNNSFWRSIPSGHTSGAFSFAIFLTYLLHKRYKNWAILFFFIALFCGWTRIYLAQHFFIDVLIGSMIGTTVTLLIIGLYNKFIYKVKS